MGRILLDWNLGLGDAILCNGLVRELAAQGHDLIYLPCYKHNFPSVAHMFSDLENVEVVPVPHGRPLVYVDGRVKRLQIGRTNPRWGSVQPFDRAFYEFAGVPFEKRWDSFHVPVSENEIPPPLGRYALVHDDPDRGFPIDPRRLGSIKPVLVKWLPGAVITDWIPMIQNAAEIHCIDSSISHLVESVPTRGALVYHQYARPAVEREPVNAVFRKAWKVLA